jgi:ribosomal protein S27AE
MIRIPMVRTVPCPRCGKGVAALNKILFGTDADKAQYKEGLCSHCIVIIESKMEESDHA